MGFYGNEIISERSIYKGDGITIIVEPDISRNFDPETAYFKVYNSENYRKATKCARISLQNPKYINHFDQFENWILNSKEKKLLNSILNKKSTNKLYSDKTVFDAAVEDFNSRTNCNLNFVKGDYTIIK